MALTYEAQTGLLGSLIIDPSIAPEFFMTAQEYDFLDDTYKAIYNTAKKIFLSGEHLDVVTISHAMKGYDDILRDLIDNTPTASTWKEYAKQAREDSICHRMNVIASHFQDVETIPEKQELYAKMGNILAGTETVDDSLRAALEAWYMRLNQPQNYLDFGLEPLCENLRIRPGSFVLLGARPSTGKTAMALQWAIPISRKHNVGFFSLETSKELIVDRILTRETHILYDKIQDRRLERIEQSVLNEKTTNLEKYCNLDIIEAAGMTADDIITRSIGRMYDVIIIDYLQLVNSSERTSYERVTAISKALHTFAQKHKVTVIGLCQLRRTREEPTMSDLRESGQLEQDADLIMMLYLYDETDRNSNRILKVEKNKFSACFKAMYNFKGCYQEFSYIPHRPRDTDSEA